VRFAIRPAQRDSPRRYGVGRGGGVGRDLGVGLTLGVGVGGAVMVGVAVGVGVGVGPDCAQYLPPVFKEGTQLVVPPQTIISLPVHTEV
jgi:hypothetical protein